MKDLLCAVALSIATAIGVTLLVLKAFDISTKERIERAQRELDRLRKLNSGRQPTGESTKEGR